MSAAWTLYRWAAPWAGRLSPLALPFLAREERALWPERRGRASFQPADVWMHAASMGEAQAVRPLLDAFEASAPGVRLHATATTRSGRARLASYGVAATLAPLDDPASTGRFFARLAPRRVVIVETELWPHWLLEAARRDVPVALVSARLSERSLRGYRRLGAPLARLVSGLAAVLCQSEADAVRWSRLGVPESRCAVIGNLKNDALPEPEDRVAKRRELGFDPARPLLVIGNLRPGEAAVLAFAWRELPAAARERWQVAVVPRHPDGAEALRREAIGAGLPVAAAGGAGASDLWRWDARLGVLRDYYAAADVAFVGGSLAPFGGHHPLEPAAAGAAVAMGPHHDSQRAAVGALEAAGAMPAIDDVKAALGFLVRLLTDDAERGRRAEAALAAARTARGATGRAMAEFARLGFWPIP